MMLLIGFNYQAQAQLGRLGVKKPKIKKPVAKKPAPTSSASSSTTSSSSSSNNNSATDSKKESASDAPKYNRDNPDNPIYKNYSKAKRYLKSTASGLESSITSLEDIEGYLEEVQEALTFLKENGEDQKQYYQEFKAAHAEHTTVVTKRKEKSAILSAYNTFFDRVYSFNEKIEQYEAKKKEYLDGEYQSNYLDELLVKIDKKRKENADKKAAANQMKMVAESKIQGYATDFHKNNTGKIVFSNETIELKNVDASKLKTSFDYGENIRFRVFMEQPIYNSVATLINADGGKKGKDCEPRSQLRYYIDGKLVYEGGYGASRMYNPVILYFPEGSEVIGYWTSYRGTLFMKDKHAHDEQEHFKEFLLKARQNLTGKHTLRVELQGFDSQNKDVEARKVLLAAGEITIDFSKKPDLRNNPVICMPKSGSNSTALGLLKDELKGSYSRISLLSYVEEKPARTIKAEVGYQENGTCYKYFVVYKQHFNYKRGVFDGPLDPDYASEKEEIFCDCLK
ncbi:MAG: hypothetical protein AB8E82_19115 [Aureispira sp.]